jgi:predicted phosphoribosyltransferase
MARFEDRREAGRALGEALDSLAGRSDTVVLALPRGGVPVAYEVAMRLGAPLDVFVVRKLGIPGHEELAVGAIASGGVRLENQGIARRFGLSQEDVIRIAAREQHELERREVAYRGARPPLDVAGKVAILVDDGLATGATMAAAVVGLRQLHPARIIVAVPVGAPQTCHELEQVADDVVCATTPEPFHAVGLWYEDFEQTSDAEVMALLREARRARAMDAPTASPH